MLDDTKELLILLNMMMAYKGYIRKCPYFLGMHIETCGSKMICFLKFHLKCFSKENQKKGIDGIIAK